MSNLVIAMADRHIGWSDLLPVVLIVTGGSGSHFTVRAKGTTQAINK